MNETHNTAVNNAPFGRWTPQKRVTFYLKCRLGHVMTLAPCKHWRLRQNKHHITNSKAVGSVG